MANTLAGTVEKIIEKQGNKGAYKSVKVDGVWFNDFNKHFEGCEVGDQVEVEYAVNGQFNNLISVKKTIVGEMEVASDRVQKVKVIKSSDVEDWEKKMNDFMQEHKR